MRIRSSVLAITLSAGLALPENSFAEAEIAQQSDPVSIEDTVVVLGSRIADNDGANAEGWVRLEAEDLSRLPTLNPVDALRGEPGLQVAAKGSVAGRNFISVRGGDENFTQIIVEQARVNDISTTSGGSFDLATLDNNFLESIEILNRPSSAIYGADAIGGIIAGRLQSYDPETPGKVWANLVGGDEGQIGGLYGLPVDNYGLAFGASHYQDEGNGGESYERSGFFASLQSDESAMFPIRIAGYYSDTEFALFPETSGGFEAAELRELEIENSEQSVFSIETITYQSEQLSWNSSFSWSNREAETTSPGILVFGTPAVPQSSGMTSFDRLDANTYVSGLIAPDGLSKYRLNYVVGANLSREEGTSSGAFDFGVIVPDQFELERDTLGLYSEFELEAMDRVSLTLGLRHDDFEGGSETTSKADIAFRANDRIKFSAHWSEGFKLPSFFALGSTLVGNPNLVPEESEHLSATVNLDVTDRVRFRVTRFHNEFRNLIEFDPNLFTNINLSLVDVDGTELEAIFEPTQDLSFTLFRIWNDYEVNGESAALRLRPENQMGLDVGWNVSDALSVAMQTFYTGERIDNYLPVGSVELDDFVRVDVSSVWQFATDKRFKLGIRNLLDDDYEETFGNPVEGARLFMGIEADF